MTASDELERVRGIRQIHDDAIEPEYAEQPGLSAGTYLRCRKCGSSAIIYPTRTVDPRWMLGYCTDCKKRQIVDVLLAPRHG